MIPLTFYHVICVEQSMETQQVEHHQRLDKMKKLQEMKIQQSDLAAKLECDELEAKAELGKDTQGSIPISRLPFSRILRAAVHLAAVR